MGLPNLEVVEKSDTIIAFGGPNSLGLSGTMDVCLNPSILELRFDVHNLKHGIKLNPSTICSMIVRSNATTVRPQLLRREGFPEVHDRLR